MIAMISAMDPGALAALIVAMPLLCAVLVAVAGRHPDLRETITLATGGITFLLLLGLAPSVLSGEGGEYVLASFLPALPLVLRPEPLGLLFALVAGGLWIVTSVYAIGYMRAHKEHAQTRFYVCFALAISFTLGVAFSGNLLTLFVFYEALTISTYPLVTHHGTPEARHGGRVYLGILLATSMVLFLPAIIWTYALAGTLDFIPGGIFPTEGAGAVAPHIAGILLLMFFFGVGKAAIMPFHRWLPSAMVAPTPVSALLHAVAVVKAGVFTLLKIAIFIFGLDLLQVLDARTFLLYVAGGGVLLASLIAMRQDNLKARLAYSTVSQLGYVTLGALLATQAGVLGAGMHIAMHAFGKITLFFCAGAIYVTAHKTEISQMRGLGRIMPLTMGAFLIGSLSIIGLPPAGGTWSKWFLMMGTLDAGYFVLMAVLMLSTLLNIAYLLPIPVRGFLAYDKTASGGKDDADDAVEVKEAPLPCLIAIGASVAGCVALFIYPGALYDLVMQVV